jgi:hypothetical protein
LLTTTDELGRQASTVYDSYNRGLVADALQAVGTAAQADTLTSYDCQRALKTGSPAFLVNQGRKMKGEP